MAAEAATRAAAIAVETSSSAGSRFLRRAHWAFVCWIVMFWRLGYPSLLDPDEAHYAELTREMAHARSWLVPLLDGVPYIDKPVLFHWMQALAVAIFGETETAIRLPSALAAVALVRVTWWVGEELFGEAVGESGALMLATIPITFLLSSVGLFDMVFTLFLFGGVACLIVAALRDRRRLMFVGYGLLTLAVLTKGPVALVLVGLLLSLAWVCDPRWRLALRRIRWPIGLAGVLVASSPWFVWMAWQFGRQFIDGYLLAGNLWYFTQPDNFSRRRVDPFFYLRTFSAGFFPWSIVLVGCAVDTIRRFVVRIVPSPEESILWMWAIVVIGFFSLARFKLDHYIFPAAPACCLLAARAWHAARHPDTRDGNIGAAWSVVVLSVLLLVLGVGSGIMLSRIDLGLSPWAVAMPLALATGGVLLGVSTMQRRLVPGPLAIPVVTFLIVYFTVVAVGFPVLERTRPVARIARTLQPTLTEDDQVGLYRLERWRASLRYYLMRPVARLEEADDITKLAALSGRAYVVMLQDDYDDLLAKGYDLRLVEAQPAVLRTSGWAVRRQQWGNVVVVSHAE